MQGPSLLSDIHKTSVVLSSLSILITEEPNYMTSSGMFVPLTGQITVV